MTLSDGLLVLLMAASPLGELRLSIPVALHALDVPLVPAFLLSLVGNSVPPLLIARTIEPASRWLMERSRLARRSLMWLFAHTRNRHAKRLSRWETATERRHILGVAAALAAIVAIPLPFTGAYSGAIAAFVFGIPPRVALPAILAGVCVSGFLVSAVALGAVPALSALLPA